MLSNLLKTLAIATIAANSSKRVTQANSAPSNVSHQILLVNPIRGSHLFFMIEVGKILADGGYNVTLLNLDPDTRVTPPSSPLFRLLVPSNSSHMVSAESHARAEVCVKELAGTYSADLGMEMSVRLPSCRDTVLEMYRNSLYFFHSQEWRELHERSEFKLIVAEERTVWAAALGTWGTGIPIAMVNPELSHILPKVKYHLPLLYSSEPGMFNIRFEEKQDIIAKLENLWSAIQLIPFAQRLEKLYKPFLHERKLNSLDQITKEIDLFFINDYPSFSFPYLLPRTVVNVGTLGFSSVIKDLPSYLTEFLIKDSEVAEKDYKRYSDDAKRTLYLSFGSYVASDLDYFEKYSLFITAAEILGLKIVISLGSDAKTFSQIFLSEEHRLFSEKVYSSDHVLVSKWLPQKSLLGSGYVSLFVSHCGNNARMESIYHQVPLLCVPMYAEQPVIANIIRYRGFGNVLLKENLTPENVVQAINTTLQNADHYRENMHRAVRVLKLSPSSVEQDLLYHVRLLLELGELSFLENDVLDRKSLVDANNLDVLCVALVLTVVVLSLVTYVLSFVITRVIVPGLSNILSSILTTMTIRRPG